MAKITLHNPFARWNRKKHGPTDVHVSLILGNHVSDDAGRHFLTPDLATESEIDHYVDSLKMEIEALRPKAKTALRIARETMRAE